MTKRYDVYMGIDTFGRGTWGGGGFDVDKALGKIRRAGVSAALFAPSWTMQEETTGSGSLFGNLSLCFGRLLHDEYNGSREGLGLSFS